MSTLTVMIIISQPYFYRSNRTQYPPTSYGYTSVLGKFVS